MTEYQFILFLIKSFVEPSKQIFDLNLNSDFNWDKFYELIHFHNVRPVIYRQLSKTDVEVPKVILERLEVFCKKNTLKAMDNLRKAKKIISELANINVSCVPFKGYHQASQYYHDIGLRETFDIDFFFHVEDLEKVKLVMEELGYYPYLDMNPTEQKQYLKSNCEYNFTDIKNQRTGTFVEFHWYSGPSHLLMNVGLPEFKYLTKKENNNLLFTTEGSLTTTILHHGCKERYRKLKYLLDIVVISKSAFVENSNRLKLEEVFKSFGLYQIYLLGMQLSYATFGLKLDSHTDEAYSNLNPKLRQRFLLDIDFSTVNRIKSFGNYSKLLFKFHLNYRDRIADKVKFIFKHTILLLKPNYRDYKSSNLPSYLNFLLYFIKPFRLIFSHKKSA